MTFASGISRILLILINTVVTLGSLGLLILGILLLRSSQYVKVSSGNLPVDLDYTGLYISIVVLGGWIFLTSILGCCGAVTRKSR